MEELLQRLEIFRQCEMVDEIGNQDLTAVLSVLNKEYQLPVTDENAGVLFTHLQAAFQRIKTGEKINPLDPGMLEQIKELPYYEKAQEIKTRILTVMQNQLSAEEQDFLQLHVCTLLSYILE